MSHSKYDEKKNKEEKWYAKFENKCLFPIVSRLNLIFIYICHKFATSYYMISLHSIRPCPFHLALQSLKKATQHITIISSLPQLRAIRNSARGHVSGLGRH